MKLLLSIVFILFFSSHVFTQTLQMDSEHFDSSILFSNLPCSKITETFNPVDKQYYYFYITAEYRLMYRIGKSQWNYFNTNGFDYKKKRNGDSIVIGDVDMVSADGNRILVKRKNSNELYFALLSLKQDSGQIYYLINDPQPKLGLKKSDVKALVSKYNLFKSYSKKMGLNLFTFLLKIQYKKKPFWLVEVKKAQTWYSIEYNFNKKNEVIYGLAETNVTRYENDSLYPNTYGYCQEIGGDYHWPLFNKWYNKWLRKDVKGNRHYTTFIDGIASYYLLTKDTSDYKTEIENSETIKKFRFRVYYTDEQTFFSQGFRLIGPETKPPKFSAQREASRTRKNLDNEKYLPWKPEKQWWDPYSMYFKDCSIDGAVENIILSTRDKIFSINWTYWSMDFSWRTRNKPAGAFNIHIIIDRDMNIIIPQKDSLKFGYYLQKLLPPDNILPRPNGTEIHFNHENNWKFIPLIKN